MFVTDWTLSSFCTLCWFENESKTLIISNMLLSIPRFVGWGGSDSETDGTGGVGVLGREISLFFPLDYIII